MLCLSFQLIIGDFGLSYEQSKAQFAIWAILAAVSTAFLEDPSRPPPPPQKATHDPPSFNTFGF